MCLNLLDVDYSVLFSLVFQALEFTIPERHDIETHSNDVSVLSKPSVFYDDPDTSTEALVASHRLTPQVTPFSHIYVISISPSPTFEHLVFKISVHT